MTAIIQTRLQDAQPALDAQKAVADANAKLPPSQRKPLPPTPELIRAGDVAFTDDRGNKMQVKDIDVNVEDVRAYDAATGWASSWVKATNKADAEAEAAYYNAKG